jgi:hypothetical protein
MSNSIQFDEQLGLYIHCFTLPMMDDKLMKIWIFFGEIFILFVMLPLVLIIVDSILVRCILSVILIPRSQFKVWSERIFRSCDFQEKLWKIPKVKGFILKIKIWNASPMPQLCKWKEDNFVQSTFNKSVMVLGTFWDDKTSHI